MKKGGKVQEMHAELELGREDDRAREDQLWKRGKEGRMGTWEGGGSEGDENEAVLTLTWERERQNIN